MKYAEGTMEMSGTVMKCSFYNFEISSIWLKLSYDHIYYYHKYYHKLYLFANYRF